VPAELNFAELSDLGPVSPHLPHPLHNHVPGRPRQNSEILVETAVYPPNCSVNLLSSLFKSLSALRVSSIFSTECSTVV